MAAHGEKWVSEGVDHIAGDSCPFCGQPLKGITLIEAYRKVFGEAYRPMKDAVAEMRTIVERDFGDRVTGSLETLFESRHDRGAAAASGVACLPVSLSRDDYLGGNGLSPPLLFVQGCLALARMTAFSMMIPSRPIRTAPPASPTRRAPCRIRTPGPIVTSPHSVASGATQAVGSIVGRFPACSISIVSYPRMGLWISQTLSNSHAPLQRLLVRNFRHAKLLRCKCCP
jgi:hypothetical protein